ncbi:MAG: hypothetical protein OEY44_02545, partial [Candidatus Peregrinibacteria bacterium]|nr:hypothetical protein [Candidatus Peregrinibacteria bacterium]
VFDDSGLLNEGLLNEGAAELAKEGLEIDNCLFDQNPDQADGDLNGAGDICEESDLCPEVPEDLDGVDDQDGCPELNDNFPETDNGVYVGPGELCGFIDYTSEGVAGDVFMTAITDLDTHDVLHATSPALTYQ